MTATSEISDTSSAIKPRIRVLVVEDHPMVRKGMRSLIENTEDLAVCGEATSAREAIEQYRRERPDVICLDLMLGASVDGLELIRELRTLDRRARILVLTVKDEDDFAERCLQVGALGYVMKTESNDALINGLRHVANGEIHLSPRIAMALLNRVRKPTKAIASLSERELQVFQLVGLGMSTRLIAERLGIGVKTVESHRESIKNKLGLEHSAALVHRAAQWVQDEL